MLGMQCAGSYVVSMHCELQVNLRYEADSGDEWEIYCSRDGDTIWTGNDEDEVESLL